MRRRRGEAGNNKIAIYSLHQDSRIRISGGNIYYEGRVDREDPEEDRSIKRKKA